MHSLPKTAYPTLQKTITNPGQTTTPKPAPVETNLDLDDSPTTVIEAEVPVVTVPTVFVDTDSQGLSTTITTVVTHSNSAPTVTDDVQTEPTSKPTVVVFSLRKEDYFIGYFLPTILAVLLAIPVRMIDLNAQRYHPFHELAHPRGEGVPARDALLLRTGGVFAIGTIFRTLSAGKPLLFLSSLLVLCSAVLIPLSGEAVSLKLYDVDGKCTPEQLGECVMALSVFPFPAHATVALLAFMAVLICGMMLVLRGWKTGLNGNPWSVAGMAALSTNGDMRSVMASLTRGDAEVKHWRLVEELRGWVFRLGCFMNKRGEVEYGVIADNSYDSRVPLAANTQHEEAGEGSEKWRTTRGRCAPSRPLPFWMLSIWGRVLFALFISGLLVVILYYNNTGGDTPFNDFMSQPTFGVRFLFTSVGVVINFFWGSLFDGKSPYPFSSPLPLTSTYQVTHSPRSTHTRNANTL